MLSLKSGLRDSLPVFLGGAMGAMTRVGLDAFLPSAMPGLGLLLANVVGTLLLVLISAVWAQPSQLHRFLSTGFCGALTSVSALNALVLLRLQDGEFIAGLLYLGLSLLLSLGLVLWVLIRSEKRSQRPAAHL